jgi:hypothetical protein
MKLKTKRIYIMFAGVVTFTSCDKSNVEVENNLPICMEDVIAAADTVDDISKIIS